jgi:putative membrane protein
MHAWDWSWHMGWMVLWWFGAPLLLALLVWALLRGRGGSERPTEPPEQILKRRYAKGEIDRETYQRILTDLKGG